MRLQGVLLTTIVTVAWAHAASIAASERSAAISRTTVSSHIEYLASDELGGRGVGSRGIDLAADYIAAQFQQLGLQPGGDEGSFFQAFNIHSRMQDVEHCRLAIPGQEWKLMPQQDFVTLPSSSSGAFEGPVVFAGYGVRNDEEGYDDYAAIDVTGAVLMILRYEPNGWKGKNAGRVTRHAAFISKGRLAKERGAKAVLVVNPPGEEKDELESAPRLVGEDAGLPMMRVTRMLADRLLQAAGQESLDTLYTKINKENRPNSTALPGIKASGDPGVKTDTTQAKNIIGILCGEGPMAQEHIVIGGHYDHLGTTPPMRWRRRSQDSNSEAAQIHNGADDNASGTAAVMELARVYATGPRPKRTLVFMAFSGEEIGLLGSEHFTDHPTIPLKDIAAMINLDMIGRLGKRAVVVYGSDSAKEFATTLDKHAAASGVEIQKAGMIQNSDHAPFYQKEIPVLFPFAGLHEDYHQPSDDVEKLDYDGAMQIMQLVLAVADELIESPTRPTYQKSAAAPANELKVRMGIVPSSIPGAEGENGWTIGGVVEGGPAAQAGMKDGDRILAINNQALKDFSDYMKIMAPYQPGDEVEVRVQRSDQQLTLRVKLIGR